MYCAEANMNSWKEYMFRKIKEQQIIPLEKNCRFKIRNRRMNTRWKAIKEKFRIAKKIVKWR